MSDRVIGVDLGGTKIAAGVVMLDGTIGERCERPTPLESQEELLEALDGVVEELGDAAAIGFGIPSTIDQRTGRAISSVNIPLAHVDFRDRMKKRFGIPGAIDNDGNAAAIAEWAVGAGRGTSDLIALVLGTGVGGGLILGGKPYRGAVGAAAGPGPIVIVPDGAPCPGACTGRGPLGGRC